MPATALNNVNLNNAEISRVFDQTFDLWGTLDSEGRVIRVSGGIFERAAVDPERLNGQMFAETVFWQSSESVSNSVTSTLKSVIEGSSETITVDFRVSAKEKIPVELCFLHTGSEHLFVYAKRVEPALRESGSFSVEPNELLFAAENAEVGIWYWQFGDDTIYSNAYCFELLGVDRSSPLTYDAFVAATHPDDREAAKEFLATTIRSGEKYAYDFRIVNSNGETEWVAAEGRSFLSNEGKPERMVGVIRKVTDEKKAADELETVYARERAARDEAEFANRSKDVFLAFVSHELRAPLNAILGWSNILLTKDVDEATKKSAIETIERSARMQTKLINDLVDSARVASGKIRLEYRPTDLFGVVKNAVDAQRPAAEARGLDCRLISDPVSALVMGDANRLQQVFGNLLSNAIKFTSVGGSVLVDIARNDTDIVVGISDTGEGISAETLPNIFQQFSQVGAGEKHSVGLGLGLSITKTLVERHGGTVTAESEGTGKGARFVVSLPILDPSKIEKPTPTVSQSEVTDPLSGLTILIVEDEDDSREVLRLHLTNLGANVLYTSSVAQAFATLDSSSVIPDLIISDIGMPDEDGISFIKRLRTSANESWAAIPALALSAFATSEIKANALEAGFQRYLTKPFDPETLMDAVLENIKAKS